MGLKNIGILIGCQRGIKKDILAEEIAGTKNKKSAKNGNKDNRKTRVSFQGSIQRITFMSLLHDYDPKNEQPIDKFE